MGGFRVQGFDSVGLLELETICMSFEWPPWALENDDREGATVALLHSRT